MESAGGVRDAGGRGKPGGVCRTGGSGLGIAGGRGTGEAGAAAEAAAMLHASWLAAVMFTSSSPKSGMSSSS
eukprot:12553546-Prorocentrum_lima.AAC.1